jgi:hypothetical protein
MGDGIQVPAPDGSKQCAGDLIRVQPALSIATFGLQIAVNQGAVRRACRPVSLACTKTGTDGARTQDRHADIRYLGLHFQRQGFGQCHHGEFGDGIAAELRRHVEARQRGGDGNVPAIGVLREQRHERPDAVYQPVEVHIEQPLPIRQ